MANDMQATIGLDAQPFVSGMSKVEAAAARFQKKVERDFQVRNRQQFAVFKDGAEGINKMSNALGAIDMAGFGGETTRAASAAANLVAVLGKGALRIGVWIGLLAKAGEAAKAAFDIIPAMNAKGNAEAGLFKSNSTLASSLRKFIGSEVEGGRLSREQGEGIQKEITDALKTNRFKDVDGINQSFSALSAIRRRLIAQNLTDDEKAAESKLGQAKSQAMFDREKNRISVLKSLLEMEKEAGRIGAKDYFQERREVEAQEYRNEIRFISEQEKRLRDEYGKATKERQFEIRSELVKLQTERESAQGEFDVNRARTSLDEMSSGRRNPDMFRPEGNALAAIGGFTSAAAGRSQLPQNNPVVNELQKVNRTLADGVVIRQVRQ